MNGLAEQRSLTVADQPAVDAFLALHRDSSMFLRFNLRRAGIAYSGAPGSAHYVGAFREGSLVGVAAHGWNGMVLMQAPAHVTQLVRLVVAESGREVKGFSGEMPQVREAQSALGLAGAEAMMDEDEGLYALDLTDLAVPGLLASGEVVCRPPRAAERGILCAWRVSYNIEALGASDTPENRRSAESFLDAQMADGNAWVALAGHELVSLGAFNAALPDIVQLGGIYTPPEYRCRGFGRAVVAASLLAARERGVSRAVLFTKNPAAARAYEALGFRRIGDYALVLLR